MIISAQKLELLKKVNKSYLNVPKILLLVQATYVITRINFKSLISVKLVFKVISFKNKSDLDRNRKPYKRLLEIFSAN